jgi:hypothetical protein
MKLKLLPVFRSHVNGPINLYAIHHSGDLLPRCWGQQKIKREDRRKEMSVKE